MLQVRFEKRTFQFKRPSGTSRGVLTEKHAWFLYLWDTENSGIVGVGECSVIPGLSPDFSSIEAYEKQLAEYCNFVNYRQFNDIDLFESYLQDWVGFPSILFGFETAMLDLQNGGKGLFYDTPFTRGETKIPINGLIWMGSEEFMQNQIEEKLEEGYSCIKMKIGAIEFEKEFAILESLRKRFSSDILTLRVDANGAFSVSEALDKLNRLASLEIHSIEQPTIKYVKEIKPINEIVQTLVNHD